MEEHNLKEYIQTLEKKVKDLESDLIHDSLTHLKTRAFFEDETKTYISAITNVNKGNRQNWFGFKNLSLLFLDIDYFKKINDTYGHDVGDVVLRRVADTIRRNVREGDTVARWGGEEMVVSLVGATENDALYKAEMIRVKVSELRFEFDPAFKVTVSIGVASTFGEMSYGGLVKSADDALYYAKDSGRNRVVAFSELYGG